MDKITQRLGFEATDAIATINRMYASLKLLNTEIRTLDKLSGKRNSKLARAFDKAGAAAGKAANKTQKYTQATQAASKSSKQFNQSLLLSAKTISRVVQVQLGIRMWNAFKKVVSEASAEVEKFNIDVARIAQISHGPGSKVKELSAEFDRLAMKLGRPIGEITQAAMEALQNDLGTTAETMELLKGAAGDLAVVTGSTLTESVNSLSSVLKAYGIKAKDAADVSDILFTAYDKGRISLKELESRLGTITPLAHTLGISFKDTAAAVASLTLSGLDARVAMTQMRNVFRSLFAPTKDLKKAYKQLGVATGKDLIQKFGGLKEALQAVKRVLGGTDDAVAHAFGTIRGQLGVLNLLSGEGKNFNGVLDAMNSRMGKTARAAREINGITARKIQQEMETLNAKVRDVTDAFQGAKLMALEFINAVIGATDSVAKLNNNRISALQKNADQHVKILEKAVKKVNAIAEARKNNGLSGEAKKNFEQLNEAHRMAEVALAKYNEQLKQTKQLIAVNAEAQKKFAGIARTETAPSIMDSGRTQEYKKEARGPSQKYAQELKSISDQIQGANSEEIAQLQEKLRLENRQVQARIDQGIFQGRVTDAIRGQMEMVRQQLLAREREIGLSKQSLTVMMQTDEIEKQIQATTGMTIDQIGSQIPAAADAAKTSLSTMQDPINAFTADPVLHQLDLIIAKAQKASQAMSTAGHQYHGGKVAYRSDGGPARGLDTQATMTAPGEFITNAASTRKFYAELQAINAGQSPQYRDKGGVVNNNSSVGDITVNVNESVTPQSTIRAIGHGLEREIRRRTQRTL